MSVDKEVLNKAVDKGLPMPFAITKAGETLVADTASDYAAKLAQVAMVIFETISALGEVKIKTIEALGENKGVIMDLDADGLVGTMFVAQDGVVPGDYLKQLAQLRAKPAAAVPMGRMALVDPGILDKIKAILGEYVGDFTERIFQNQMKNQGINTKDLHGEDVRRLILALAKATGLIVGRKKGRELSSRLTELVK